jgi:hypothetical protein
MLIMVFPDRFAALHGRRVGETPALRKRKAQRKPRREAAARSSASQAAASFRTDAEMTLRRQTLP